MEKEIIYYFPNDLKNADSIYGSAYPCCICRNEVIRLSKEWNTDLFAVMHEATKQEIAKYGIAQE